MRQAVAAVIVALGLALAYPASAQRMWCEVTETAEGTGDVRITTGAQAILGAGIPDEAIGWTPPSTNKNVQVYFGFEDEARVRSGHTSGGHFRVLGQTAKDVEGATLTLGTENPVVLVDHFEGVGREGNFYFVDFVLSEGDVAWSALDEAIHARQSVSASVHFSDGSRQTATLVLTQSTPLATLVEAAHRKLDARQPPWCRPILRRNH